MLEQETEHILRTLSGHSIGERDGITLAEALAANMPKGVKAYLQAEVMQWLRDDLRHAPHFARTVDRTGGLGALTKAFLRTLGEQYQFTRPEYLSSLDNAVHFLENFVCRPRWTLENFILENRSEVPPETVLAKLDYLYDYAYFRELIERFARAREGKAIPAGELKSVIATIDEQVLKQHSSREMALLARPIFELLLLSDDPASGVIPVAPVLVFFEDKTMTILKEYIESICHIRNRPTVSLNELSAMIEDLRLGVTPPPAPEPVPEEPASPSNNDWEGFGRAASPSEDNLAPSPTTQPEEPMPPFAEPPDQSPEFSPEPQPAGPETPASPPATATPGTTPAPAEPLPHQDSQKPAEPKEKQNIPLSLTSAGLKSPLAEPALPDLNKIIPDDQRQRFIKKMFSRDEKYYAGVIGSLNKARSWKDASLYLNRLYQVNKLDPYAKEVIEFTDTIQKRFGGTQQKHP